MRNKKSFPQGAMITAFWFLVMVVSSTCMSQESIGWGGNVMLSRRFQPCPGSPNCVSSLSKGSRHFIQPIHFTGTPESALDCLTAILGEERRVRIVVQEKGYLHAEFRTWLGFVDDEEFLVDSEKGLVHMRSASRFGYWDLGVNRRRLEHLRARFLDNCSKNGMVPFGGHRGEDSLK